MKYLFIGPFLLALIFLSCKKEDDAPIFSIQASALDIPTGGSVTFTSSTTAEGDISWTIEGGNITTFSGPGATITFSTEGIFEVTATLTVGTRSSTEKLRILVHPAYWTCTFPGGGQANNGGTIGDFCCTGETYTLKNLIGAPLGYAYFLNWEEPVFNLPEGFIIPNFYIEISGGSDLKGGGQREFKRLFFADFDCVIGRARSAKVGNINYTATIVDLKYPVGTPYVGTHIYKTSLKVKLEARWAE